MDVDGLISSRWETSANPDEVHALLCACDSYTATPGTQAPLRNIETTKRHVSVGAVHVLRFRNEAVAMFTLTWEAPFSEDPPVFPPARKPLYISRLAVKPEWLAKGSLVGVQCLRRAVELAESLGADVLRSEANPDLTRVRTLLQFLGFVEHAQKESADGRRSVYLQKTL